MPEQATTESTATRGGNAPANVSVEQLTAMLKRKPATAAAEVSPSPVNTAATTGATDGEETTTTDPALSEAGAQGSSSDGSEGATEQPAEEGVEQEATESAEGDGAEAAGEEGDGRDVPKAIKEMRKRINALTKQKADAERALEALRAEKTQPEAKAPVASAASSERFGDDPEVAKHSADLKHTKEVLKFAENALHRLARSGEESIEIGGRVFELPELQQILWNSQSAQIELAVAKATRTSALEQQFQNARAQHNAIAVKAYPFLADETSPEFEMANELYRNAGEVLKGRPDAAVLIGDLIAGRAARLAKANGKAPGGTPSGTGGTPVLPKGKPAPIPGTGSAGAVRVDPKKAALAEAEATFAKSGREKDLVKLLKLKRG